MVRMDNVHVPNIFPESELLERAEHELQFKVRVPVVKPCFTNSLISQGIQAGARKRFVTLRPIRVRALTRKCPHALTRLITRHALVKELPNTSPICVALIYPRNDDVDAAFDLCQLAAERQIVPVKTASLGLPTAI